MTLRKVLLCGGPSDGEWVSVDPTQTLIEVPVIKRESSFAIAEIPKLLERYRYHIFPMQFRTYMNVHQVWVGIDDRQVDWEAIVFRTVMQRDAVKESEIVT